MSTQSTNTPPIAIVGVACQLPGKDKNIESLETFWQLLSSGESPIGPFPKERWTDKYDCKQIKGAFLNDIDLFDAAYFHLQAEEAKEIDPQHRLFLSVAIHALNNANVCTDHLAGSNTGVFCGISTHEYEQLTQQSIPNHYTSVGYAASGAAGRLAYHLDLRGPALAIDTACSSSLSALNVATQSLSQRECDTAIVGGVSLNLLPDVICQHTEAKMISPDGIARCFDEKANGYVRSEGCVVVILKRLEDALTVQDTIHGVIKAVSLKQDGRSLGFKAPSLKAQTQLYKDVLSKASLTPSEIKFVEAHAAGTPLGDPTEFNALKTVFENQFDNKAPLMIGAVKSQIGHCVAVSGLVALLKILACFKYNAIPKNHHFSKAHQDIKINSIPAHLPTEETPWPETTHPRYAMLNNFGFTGTIGSTIIESPPVVSTQQANPTDTPQCFFLSAHTRAALDKSIMAYIDFLKDTDESLENICYTAAIGRDHHRLRVAIVCNSKEELIEHLAKRAFHITLHIPDETLIPVNDQPEEQQTDFLSGKRLDFKSYFKECGFHKVNLPHYTFDKSAYWHEAKPINHPDTLIYNKKPASIEEVSVQKAKEMKCESFNTLLKETPLQNKVFPLLGEGQYFANDQYVFNTKIDLDTLHRSNKLTDEIIFSYPLSAYIDTLTEFKQHVLTLDDPISITGFKAHFPFIAQNGSRYQVHIQKTKTVSKYQVTYYQTDQCDFHKQSEMVLSFTVNNQTSASHLLNNLIIKTFKDTALTAIQLKSLAESYEKRINPFLDIKTLHRRDDAFWAVLNENTDVASLDLTILLIEHLLAPNCDTPYYISTIDQITHLNDVSNTHAIIAKQNNNKQSTHYTVYLLDINQRIILSIESLILSPVSTRDQFYLAYHNDVIYFPDWEKIAPPKPSSSTFYCIHPNIALLTGASQTEWYQSAEDIQNITEKDILYVFHEEHFLHLVKTTKWLLKHQPKSITLITHNAYAIPTCHEPVNPHHTAASSFWKSFRIELGDRKVKQIDFSNSIPLSSMLSFLSTHNLREQQYAYRNSLFIPRVNGSPSHAILNNRLNSLHPPSDVSRSQCCFITGGAGALGQLLINYLALKGEKYIYTASRHRPSRTYRKLRKRLKQQGVFLYHTQTDIRDKEHLKKLLKTIQSQHQIDSIYHLAGITNDAMIFNLNENQIKQVLDTKAYAAWHLHELTQEIALKHFVLFSSTTGLLGASGQSSYAAANGFLDGLSHLRNAMNLPCVSINWGPWDNLGMAKGLDKHHQRKGNIPLLPKDIYLLDLILEKPINQVICNRFDWQARVSQDNNTSLFANIEPFNAAFNKIQPRRVTAHKGDIANTVLTTICHVLNITDKSMLLSSESLYHYGLDSLLSIEIRNQLQQHFEESNLQLPVEVFLISPSIDTITKAVHERLINITKPAQVNPKSNTFSTQVSPIAYPHLPANLTLLMGFSILPMSQRYQIKGELDVSLFEKALHHVLTHQVAFRLSLNESQLNYHIDESPNTVSTFIDLQDATSIDQALSTAYYDKLYSIKASPLTHRVSAFIYQYAPSCYELHLFISHLIADAYSFIILFKQVEKTYRALLSSAEYPTLAVNKNYLQYIQRTNKEMSNHAEKKTKFWQSYNKKRQLFMPHFSMFSTGAVKPHEYLTQFLIDDKLLKSFFSTLREKNHNIHYAIISLTYMALQSLKKQPPFQLSVVEDMRSYDDKESIGYFTKRKTLCIPTTSHHSFMHVHSQVEQEALRIAEYQSTPTFVMVHTSRSLIRRLLKPLFVRYLERIQLPILKHLRLPKSYQPSLYDILLDGVFIQMKNRLTALLNKWFNIKSLPSRFRGLTVILNIYRPFIYDALRQFNFPGTTFVENQHLLTFDQHICDDELYIILSRDLNGRPILSINSAITHTAKTTIANAFIIHLKNAIKELNSVTETSEI